MGSHYDFDWHVRHREGNSYSASRITGILRELLPIRSVVDFGCGDGVWLSKFLESGAERILGYDGPWNKGEDLLIDRLSMQTADLSVPLPRSQDTEMFDLAVCLEVAEHLPNEASATLVQSICDHAPVALFGAAIPNQGGYRHINEQWQSYWCDLFARQGYQRFDVVRPAVWGDPKIYFWYKQNTALFVRSDRQDLVGRVTAAAEAGRQMPMDVVHPDLFDSIANYDQIAFRPLSRRLLPNTLRKIRTMVSERLRT